MKRTSMISTVLLLVTAFLAACVPLATKQPPDEVALQLKWVHQAQFAGFYVAQERGYYAEENIEVTFVEGGPGIDVMEQVVTGQTEFGIEASDLVLQHCGKGVSIAAVAVIYRRNPLAFVSMADSGIEEPADFLGRTVALSSYGELQFAAIMKRLGLNVRQVEFVPFEYDYGSFYSGDVDVTDGYSTAGLIRMRQQGYEVNTIRPSNYGVLLYADALITTDQMIAENPELVARVLRATLRGWREAIEQQEAAVETTLQYAREADAELQSQMLEASVPLIHTGEDQIGWMRAEVWQGMHDILLEQGILDEPVGMDKVYTMDFLHAVYSVEASTP